MAWLNPPGLQAGCFEDIGTALRDTSTAAATPRRIWEPRHKARCLAPLCCGCCFCAQERACFSWGPSVTVRRGRSGRAAGVAKEGNAFSTGQESGRKARPRLTDFSPTDGRKASPRGVVFSWLLLFWTSKREVARPPTGGRNRLVTCDNTNVKQEPLSPSPASGRGEQSTHFLAARISLR